MDSGDWVCHTHRAAGTYRSARGFSLLNRRKQGGVALSKATKTRKPKRAKQHEVALTPDVIADLMETFPTYTPALQYVEVVGNPQRMPKPHPSRIRVQLNRPLSWAEAEDVTHQGVEFKLTVNADRTHVRADGAMNSRQMYRILAKVLADNYVNVFPRAVRTWSEYRALSVR